MVVADPVGSGVEVWLSIEGYSPLAVEPAAFDATGCRNTPAASSVAEGSHTGTGDDGPVQRGRCHRLSSMP